MQQRPLGRTGLSVPVICLGTMTWGQQNTEAEGHAQMDYALERGVNFFDTAEVYSIPPKPETRGSTERIIGAWFKSRKNRDRIILASKVSGRTEFGWMRAAGGGTRLNRAQMTEALDGSLKRLGTDYLDLYQFHAPDRRVTWGSNPIQYNPKDYARTDDETPFAEQLAVLADFVKAGKVRAVGLSNESAWGTMRFVAESDRLGLPRMASIQNAYNLLNRTFETALAETAIREQVSLLAFSPLGQGYLTGKYLDGARPAGARTTLFNRGQRYERPGCESAIRDYLEVAQAFGLTPAGLAHAFVLSRPFVTSSIIGATSMDQLKEAIDAAAIVFTPEMEARVNAVHQVRGNPAW